MDDTLCLISKIVLSISSKKMKHFHSWSGTQNRKQNYNQNQHWVSCQIVNIKNNEIT